MHLHTFKHRARLDFYRVLCHLTAVMAAMNDIPKELLRAAYQRKSIHLLKIPFGFGVWAGVVWVLFQV